MGVELGLFPERFQGPGHRVKGGHAGCSAAQEYCSQTSRPGGRQPGCVILDFEGERSLKAFRVSAAGSFSPERVEVTVVAFGFTKRKMNVERLQAALPYNSISARVQPV